MSYGSIHARLVVEGDSITASQSAPWAPAALSRAADRNVFDLPAGFNQAAGGELASQMARQAEAVNALNPDIVVLLAGTNDLSASLQSPSQIYANLRQLWRSYLDEGADYVLTVHVLPRSDDGWQNIRFREADRLTLNDLISRYATDPVLAGYVDRIRVVGDIGFNPATETQDGLHPNAAGAQRLGSAIGALETLGIHGDRALDLSIARGFDAEFYLQVNGDVRTAAVTAGVDSFAFARRHYDQYGWHEGRAASAIFDTASYLESYADVAAAGVNPLTHYNEYGWREGRDPSAAFDSSDYLAAYADVRAAGVNPMLHYLQFGVHEGRLAFGDASFGGGTIG